MSRDVLTMSFAPRDSHEAQVQFALERGVPAMIGVLASKRLPYPARAFDMAHCSRCLIPWQLYGIPFLSLFSLQKAFHRTPLTICSLLFIEHHEFSAYSLLHFIEHNEFIALFSLRRISSNT